MNGKTNASDVTIDQVVNGVLIPLEPATNFQIGSGSGRAYFTWTDPVDKYTNPGDELVSEWEKTVVTRKENSAPTSPDDGTIVLTETIRNQYQSSQYSDTDVENNKTYYYSVFPINTLGLNSNPIGDYAIPLGGEPAFKTYFEDSLEWINPDEDETISSLNEVAMCSNDTAMYIVGGLRRQDYSCDPYDKIVSFNSDLTKQFMNNPYNDAGNNYIVATLGEYAMFINGSTGSYSTNYQTNYPKDHALVIDNDMVIQLKYGLLENASRLSSVNCGSCISNNRVLFGGGFNIDTNDVNNAIYSLDINLTQSQVDSISNNDRLYQSFARCYLNGYFIFGAGYFDYENNYYLSGIDLSVIAYDDDLTKNTSIESLSTQSTNACLPSCTMVDQYAIFSIRNSDYETDGMGKLYNEGYDSNLTHLPLLSTLDVSDMYQITQYTQVHNSIAQLGTCIGYKQYGNYAFIPISVDDGMICDLGLLMFDKDLIMKYNDISYYIFNIKELHSYYPDFFYCSPSTIGIFKDMLFMYINGFQCANANGKEGLLIIFTL